MKNIAVFASGSGTNAEKLFEKFHHHPQGRVALLLTNNSRAGVIRRAEKFNVPVEIFDRATLQTTDQIVTVLLDQAIDFVVLAGFMLKVPEKLIHAFPDRIINIHPALLPAYGGKGMYGQRVHEAVVAAGETETGISIHYVNEHYDEGRMILQVSCPVAPHDSAEDVATKVHRLEHQYYPRGGGRTGLAALSAPRFRRWIAADYCSRGVNHRVLTIT